MLISAADVAMKNQFGFLKDVEQRMTTPLELIIRTGLK